MLIKRMSNGYSYKAFLSEFEKKYLKEEIENILENGGRYILLNPNRMNYHRFALVLDEKYNYIGKVTGFILESMDILALNTNNDTENGHTFDFALHECEGYSRKEFVGFDLYKINLFLIFNNN